LKETPPVGIQGDAIQKASGWEPFAGLGDVWELSGKEVSSPRPEGDALPISPGKTRTAVELLVVQHLFLAPSTQDTLRCQGNVAQCQDNLCSKDYYFFKR